MMKFFTAILVLAILGAVSPLHAAESKPPKELVERLSKLAHDGLLKVKNPEGQTIVKPEDAKKLTYPIVTYEDREMAVARGYISGNAKWCGLDWGKNYYAPYMKAIQLEHGKKWTPHQYAYVEVLHGLSMAVAEKSKKGAKCSAAEKQKISALAKK